MAVREGADALYVHVENRGIGDAEGGDIRVVDLCRACRGDVGLADDGLADYDKGENDAHDAERICDGAGEGSVAYGQAELLQRLLGGAERGGVGRRSAEHAHEVGYVLPALEREGESHEGAEDDDCEGEKVELDATLAEGAEKARSDLESELVDEEHESEALGVGEHRRVYRQSEVSGEDAGEEHEGDAERYAADAQFAQTETYRDDKSQHHKRLQGRLLEKKILKPVHRQLICA